MKNKDSNSSTKSFTRMLLVSLGSGLLTLVVAGLAAYIGFTIDRRAGEDLRWTLILLIGSMPISLVGAYLISRSAVRKLKAEQAAQEEALAAQEEALVAQEGEVDAPEGGEQG